MFDTLITLALRQRAFIIIIALALLGYGLYAVNQISIEAFPDVQDVQVQVVTQAIGQAPEEVERTVSLPIEREMSGVPGMTQLRSVSITGLSVVTLTFNDKTADYFARQQVLERLQTVSLPPGIQPVLAPLTTAVGEIYRYVLEAPPNAEREEIRAIQDWTVRPALRMVPGIADVVSFGGAVREMQVRIDPELLRKYAVSLEDVTQALASASANGSGGLMRRGDEALVVRTLGLFQSLDDVRDVVVVASAGNDGKSEQSYPAAEAGVISVAGIVNGQRNLHPLSRRGPTWVDVAAPWCNWVVMGSPDYFCGTSSSAPLVTGTAALLRTIRPAADRQMIATALLTTADHAPTTGLVGYGILDAGRAAAAVSTVAPGPTPNPPDVTPPTATMTAPGGYQIGSTVVQVVSDDDQGIVMVEVRLDGTLVAALANPARVQDLRFDTGSFGDGPHVVEAVVTDVGGHRVLAGSATMVTDNANPLGLLVSPSAGAKVSGSYVARVFVTDPNGIMGTFFIANDQVVGGFLGAGFGQVTVPVTRSGPIRVVALTVDNAGHISGTNTAVVTGSVPRRKARR